MGIVYRQKPTEKVQLWVENELSSLPNVTIIKEQWTSENIGEFSLSVVKEERYITTAIADDDALKKYDNNDEREKLIN